TFGMDGGSVSQNVNLDGGSGGATIDLVDAEIGSKDSPGSLSVDTHAEDFEYSSSDTDDGSGTTSYEVANSYSSSSGAISATVENSSISQNVELNGGSGGAALSLTGSHVGENVTVTAIATDSTYSGTGSVTPS